MPRDVILDHDVRLTFATPILERRIAGGARLTRGLRRAILARERRGAGRPTSNVGGWHSEPDSFSWPEPEVAALRRAIHAAVVPLLDLRQGAPPGGRDVELADEAWALVLRRGDSSRTHIHSHNHFSGVFYVATGTAPASRESGMLVFSDPRPAATALPLRGLPFGGEHVVKPRPGLLVIFPSWLPHAVLPFRGTGARISISFNVRVHEVRG